MYIENMIWGYIDPNTSQHVFSLFGPMLAFLATAGGLVVASLVFVRHRIVSYFRKASWTKRLATLSVATVVLTAAVVLVCKLIW